jgi:hypothetical protein
MVYLFEFGFAARITELNARLAQGTAAKLGRPVEEPVP